MQGNCAESINQMKLNEIQHLKKEIQNRNDSIPENFAKYLILLAEMNEQPCIETEIDEIMKVFHVINEKEDLLRFFQLIRIAKENNILKYLQTLSTKYKPKEKENKSWFQSVKKSILLFMKAFQVSYISKEEINQIEEIFLISKFTIVFLNFWINLNKKQAIPTSLITLFNKLSKEQLKDCQNFLEFSFQCEIVEPTEVKEQLYYGLQLYTKKRNNTNFLKPINQKISELNSLVKQENDKRTREIQMQKKRENQIKILRKKMDLLLITMKDQFIPWETIFSIFNLLPELEEEFREKLITHNKKIIEDKKKILKYLKEQFPDPFINLFLDFGYNITLLNPEEIDTLKKSKSLESFEQLLKHLSHKIFSFFTINHPKFVEILLYSTDTTLINVKKEIRKRNLTPEYVKNFYWILYPEYFQRYLANKKLILENQMNLKFFWQSDLLFKETELFQKILKLIKLYHCGQIVFYNLNYFNEVDRLIENRFFPLTEENQRSDSFNNLSPFDIENIENEEEIIWLDKNFAVDKIRYFIGSHIISRLKVLRFFKYFNSIKENRAENLVEAVLEQSQFFEFEKELIVEELSHLIRKKDC